jgi:murein DD-endopeptidase MepM/ murein hydrolase activator NlpD
MTDGPTDPTTLAPAAPPRRRSRRRAAVLLAVATTVGGAAAVGGFLAAAPAGAAAAPAFQLPFPCGQTWSGQTRGGHSPANAVDFNRANDVNDPVVASAAGTVSVVRNLGNRSYGRYVVVSHGRGWTTYYAHLNSASVRVGDRVSAGARIGTLGSTGGSTGPHLHFEQRLNGSVRRVVFNGSQAFYWGTRSYTSRNACGSSGGGGGGGAQGRVETAGAPLTVRSGPGTGHRAAGTVADRATVRITCQTTGTSVRGTYGTSRIWDRIGPGRYISDAYVYTGSDGRVAPAC